MLLFNSLSPLEHKFHKRAMILPVVYCCITKPEPYLEEKGCSQMLRGEMCILLRILSTKFTVPV